jgi:hypothetical protein
VLPLEPDWDAAPLGPVEVVALLAIDPVALEPAVPPPAPLDVPAVATPLVADAPLAVPDDPVAPLVVPVEASAPAPLASDPPPATPESRGISAPASTGVVAIPVAPQKTRCAALVFVICTPVSIAEADGVIWIPSIVWPVGSTSMPVVFHLPVAVMR